MDRKVIALISQRFDTWQEILDYLHIVEEEYDLYSIVYDEEIIYNERLDKYIVIIVAYDEVR